VTGTVGLSGGLPTAAPNRDREQLRQAAQAFEAVFLRQLIGSMRQARLADDPFSSRATEQFQEMSDARLADSMSQQGSFGIAEMLLAQFDRSNADLAPETGTAAQLQSRVASISAGAGQGPIRPDANDEVER
jgi:flagellar protein FlgJ